MKKSRFLVLALVVAVMMMGAGYAAWTEQVTITNNVCTGELDVDLQDGGFVNTFSAAGVPDDTYATGDYTVDATDANKATVSIEGLYPGAIVEVSIPVKNVGTLKAIEDNVVAPDLSATPWLTCTNVEAPDALDVNDVGNITYTLTCDSAADETVMAELIGETGGSLPAVEFDVVANYKQFNQ